MLVQTRPGFPDTKAVGIPLQNDMVALVDPDWFDILSHVHWYAKKSRGKYYACWKVTEPGHTHFIRMHQFIAHTPKGMVCHHINGNSLDNRSANLQNMTWYEHAKYYSYR